MEEKLNLFTLLSLKEICLRKVTILLWSKTNILESIDGYDVDDKVKDDTSKLELPSLLTEQIKNLVRPIGFQIRAFRNILEKYLNIPNKSLDLRILRHLSWTSLGSLNYKKTAEKLIRQELFNCVKMYKLACLFCLEDYILDLWIKLPVSIQRAYKEPMFFFPDGILLDSCWPNILKKEKALLDRMVSTFIGSSDTFNQWAFEYSAHQGNRAATEYFFLKLTEEERELSLFRTTKAAVKHRLDHFQSFEQETFPEERLSDTVFYLLQLMSSEKQLEILKTYPYHVFMCLLDWPWQHHLLDTIGLLSWEHLLEIDNDWLYLRIAKELKKCNFPPKLFQDIFLLSSRNSKKSFIGRECKLRANLEFFLNQDLETIKIIFRNVEYVDRKRLISCEYVFSVFYHLILKGKLNFVELCFEEATLSKEDKEELKETYFVFIKDIQCENINRKVKIWKQLCRLFDEEKEITTN